MLNKHKHNTAIFVDFLKKYDFFIPCKHDMLLSGKINLRAKINSVTQANFII